MWKGERKIDTESKKELESKRVHKKSHRVRKKETVKDWNKNFNDKKLVHHVR